MDEDLEPFSQVFAQVNNTAFFHTFSTEAGIALGIMLILIIFSALISGSETAFFSIVPQKLKAESKSNLNEKVLKLLEKPRKLLATILIANNFINVGIVVLGTFITAQLFNLQAFPVIAFITQVVILTALLLLFGEILPKVYAAHSSYKFAQIMVRPLALLSRVFSPLSFLLVSSTNAIDRRMKEKSHDMTMDDLNNAIEITKPDKQTPEQNEEQKILKGIAKFGDIDVKEIMKSRVDVVALDESTEYEKVLKIINQSGFSRIPVYRESFDNIQGVIYIKDLLGNLNEDNNFRWNSFIRPAFYVPENKKISDLLLEFQEKKIHLAIVVDEYGGTSGIITMEDILEEIVGEIVDEFDTENDSLLYKKINERESLFEGKILLNDFCKTLNIDDSIFEDVRGDADTLAGFLLEKLGKIPEKGTTVKHENFTFIVQSVSDRRISRIIVRKDD